MRNDARTVNRTRFAGAALALWRKRRQEVIEMLEACGIDRSRVPLDTPFRRNGGSVFLQRCLVSDTGMKLCDPRSGSLLIEQIEIRPPVELIPDWISTD